MYKSKKCLYSFHRPFLLLTEDSVSKWLCFTLCLIFFFFERSKGVKWSVGIGDLGALRGPASVSESTGSLWLGGLNL